MSGAGDQIRNGSVRICVSHTGHRYSFVESTLMKISKILCPIDFSEFNQLANGIASDIASICGASIVYLAVADQGSDDYAYAMERTIEKTLEQLSEFHPKADGIEHAHEVRVSNLTAQAIVEFANSNDVDLIVLATHGRSGWKRILMGSVAESILRTSRCPVLTVKPDSEHSDATSESSTANLG